MHVKDYILDKLTQHLERNYESGKDKKVTEYYVLCSRSSRVPATVNQDLWKSWE